MLGLKRVIWVGVVGSKENREHTLTGNWYIPENWKKTENWKETEIVVTDEFWRTTLSYIGEFENQIARVYAVLEGELEDVKVWRFQNDEKKEKQQNSLRKS